MRFELLPGTENVFLFSVERAPRVTLDLLREIAPDVRLVMNQAAALGLARPDHTLRDRTDAETANYIALQLPTEEPHRAGMLHELEERILGPAVDAARAAHDAAAAARDAACALDAARTSQTRFWLHGLQVRADEAAERATIMMLQAHESAEKLEGVSRAVGFARRREPWIPRNHETETDELIAIGTAFA